MGAKFTKFSEHTVAQSSALYMHVLDFRYVAPFLNAGNSNGTVVESRGQIADSLTLCKNEEWDGRNV